MPILDCEIKDIGNDTVDHGLERMKQKVSSEGWVFKRKIGSPESFPTMYEFTKAGKSRFIWNSFSGLNDYTV